ncbi:MAG: RBBP9/YdeN family alpha/beta hydrolase [Candidatus Rifleibacteriota bacterium]
MARVYIVHGFGASPSDHWFQWLKGALEREGAQVCVLAMPDSSEPELPKWVSHLGRQVGGQENCLFIGHSLGCITLLHFLSNSFRGEIAGLILVSPFDQKLENRPIMDSFTRARPDYSELKRRCNQSFVFASDNDSIIPVDLSKKVSEKLAAEFILVRSAGHFLASDGFCEFFELLDPCMKVLKSSN